MQKKMRLRFLLIIWGLLLLFMLALCAGIGFFLYQSAVRDTEEALRVAAETEQLTDESRGMAGIELDEHGGILTAEQSHLKLSEDALQALVDQIDMEGEQSIGMTELEGVRYRYLALRRRGGVWLAAAECMQEMTVLRTMRRYIWLFALLGTVLLFPVCLLLSRWASRPIEIAWDKQNDFVSDATHELKTPLAVIAANTEAVLANPDASVESQEKWLDSIQGETMRMGELVASLLFLAKIDAGEIKLNAEDIAISEQLEGLCMEREANLFEAGKQFDYTLTPELVYHGDWQRIRQMVAELLDNAEKYTAKGGNIRVILNRDRRQRLRIIVSNTGTLLSEDELEKIFLRFYRVDPSRARDTGGYGLGLCVAKSIAELHGGTIIAESRNGMNIFTVLLGNVVTDADKMHKNKKKKTSAFGT